MIYICMHLPEPGNQKQSLPTHFDGCSKPGGRTSQNLGVSVIKRAIRFRTSQTFGVCLCMLKT